MTRQRPYTWDEVAELFTSKAARYVARRYGRYGVTYDDARQEALLWMFGPGRPRIERWLANEPQQTTRCFRSLLDAGMQFAEREKATQCGYDVSDVEWYTPRMVEAMMPLVLDETFTGQSAKSDGPRVTGGGLASQGNEAVAAVMDIRRALSAGPTWVSEMFALREPGVAGWDDAVQWVINFLGGTRPWVGRRRVVSNAAAQSITTRQEQE